MTLIILLIFLTGLSIMMVFLAQGPPFVASDDTSAKQMLQLLKTQEPKRLIDLGSGDGKLVIMLAEQGYRVDGVEINPLLVLKSRRAIKQAGLNKQANIIWGNLWRYDTSRYDAVVLYAIKHIMPHLEKKLKTELKSGSIIVSNYFVFKDWKPVKSLSRGKLYKV